jgi:hypothetical protein
LKCSLIKIFPPEAPERQNSVGTLAGTIMAYLEAMKKKSEPQSQPNAAALNPAVKSWLDNVLVPAMVRQWIRVDGVGASAMIEDPPPRTDSEISKKLQFRQSVVQSPPECSGGL